MNTDEENIAELAKLMDGITEEGKGLLHLISRHVDERMKKVMKTAKETPSFENLRAVSDTILQSYVACMVSMLGIILSEDTRKMISSDGVLNVLDLTIEAMNAAKEDALKQAVEDKKESEKGDA